MGFRKDGPMLDNAALFQVKGPSVAVLIMTQGGAFPLAVILSKCLSHLKTAHFHSCHQRDDYLHQRHSLEMIACKPKHLSPNALLDSTPDKIKRNAFVHEQRLKHMLCLFLHSFAS